MPTRDHVRWRPLLETRHLPSCGMHRRPPAKMHEGLVTPTRRAGRGGAWHGNASCRPASVQKPSAMAAHRGHLYDGSDVKPDLRFALHFSCTLSACWDAHTCPSYLCRRARHVGSHPIVYAQTLQFARFVIWDKEAWRLCSPACRGMSSPTAHCALREVTPTIIGLSGLFAGHETQEMPIGTLECATVLCAGTRLSSC